MSDITFKRRSTSFSRQFPRVDLIFNSVSGQGDPQKDLVVIKEILSRSFDSVKVWNTTPEQPVQQLGRQALEDGGHVLVACGGDGTIAGVACAVQEVLSTSPHIHPILGAIPRGTANALCGALGIPSHIKQAAKMITSGHIRSIDLPHVTLSTQSTPSSMLLLCGIGLEAETVCRADRGMKRFWGVGAYAMAGLASACKQPCFRSNITLYDVQDALMFADGVTECKQLHLNNMKLTGVTIANAAPATSVLAQGIGTVRPDDGLLEVVCIATTSPWGTITTMLSMLRSALLRTREHRGNIYGLRAKKVEITCVPPQRVVIDGEDGGLTPITIELKNSHVQVIAPKASTLNRRRRRLSRTLVRLWRNLRGVTVLAVTIAVMKQIRAQEI